MFQLLLCILNRPLINRVCNYVCTYAHIRIQFTTNESTSMKLSYIKPDITWSVTRHVLQFNYVYYSINWISIPDRGRNLIHKDLGISTTHEIIHGRSTKHRAELQSHSNPLVQSLPRDNVLQRLKRRWPADL
jgi:hypothetical protein